MKSLIFSLIICLFATTAMSAQLFIAPRHRVVVRHSYFPYQPYRPYYPYRPLIRPYYPIIINPYYPYQPYNPFYPRPYPVPYYYQY